MLILVSFGADGSLSRNSGRVDQGSRRKTWKPCRPALICKFDRRGPSTRRAGVTMRRGGASAHPASTQQILELRDQA